MHFFLYHFYRWGKLSIIRKLRKRKSNLIICMLSFCQLIASILPLLDEWAMMNATLCRVVAVLMHFFLMSKIVWVAILALHFYLELVYISINVFITAKLVLAGIGKLILNAENIHFIIIAITWP